MELIRGDSRVYKRDKAIDVLHIDGDHTYEAVRADITRYARMVTKGGIVIFDDYDHTHPGVVLRAVHESLAKRQDYVVMAVNNGVPTGLEYGSICLRRSL